MSLLTDRRCFLAFFSELGQPTTLLPGVLMTNLTGHPVSIVPNGFRENGTPVSLSFLGRLCGEAKLLNV